nr:hypothetical protein [Streptomyces sp. Alain-F2R5]
MLLALGADLELADPDGLTPMVITDHYGHDLAVQLLRTHITGPSAGNR